jgi:hypothetical protein
MVILVIIRKGEYIMYTNVNEFNTGSSKVKRLASHYYKLSNSVTKRGFIYTDEDGTVESARFFHNSNLIGDVEVVKTFPESADIAEEYFSKYFGLILNMENDIELNPRKAIVVSKIKNLDGHLVIIDDKLKYIFSDLDATINFASDCNHWQANTDESNLYRTLDEAVSAIKDYKESLEKVPTLIPNMI